MKEKKAKNPNKKNKKVNKLKNYSEIKSKI